MCKHKLILILNFLLLAVILGSTSAQPFSIGNIPVTYTDPGRANRQVPVQIFYPSDTPGQGVPVAEGTYPVIAFGHGFVMVYSAYEYLWQALAPMGYILVFPTTEGGFSPDHLALGLDLRFVVGKMKAEGLNPSSPFYQHIADSSAIMGHSMGGGAAFLACENFSEASALITFAAAETNPSAINAAQNISIPALVFSGSNDCVTPPPDHQAPMYNNLAAPCKTFISITGGGHCYFAGYNFYCAIGEATCSPSPAITRAQQHAAILGHLTPYLEFMLKGNQQSWINFNNLLNNPAGITSERNCNIGLYDLNVLLEGPFDGSLLDNTLNVSGIIPLSQPYASGPWFYYGQESVNIIPNAEVVDWILIEIRDAVSAAAAGSSAMAGRRAALLLRNGTIVNLDGESFVRFDHTYQNMPFVVIHHRNHLSVMSSFPLTNTDGVFGYDFSTATDQAYGTIALKELGNGIFGMYGGDFNADGAINSSDKELNWYNQAGQKGYLQTDCNLDGQSDNQDKNDRWADNFGKNSQVPE